MQTNIFLYSSIFKKCNMDNIYFSLGYIMNPNVKLLSISSFIY